MDNEKLLDYLSYIAMVFIVIGLVAVVFKSIITTC